jgi:tetratricopeptide (TPR) repeat protein
MGETDNNRLTLLTQFLQQNPNDAFARYGLAMEHSRLGQTETALEQFSKLLALHPDYTNGYFMAAQTLERVGRTAEAKKMLESGIAAAQRTGNKHAASEMSGMLEELGSV